MNSTRLFVLGALARQGPMHGHQIRRAAQMDRTELWTDVKPGSLYGALHRMHAEGLIEALRSERQGAFPARTIYAITSEGRREFDVQRDAALRQIRLSSDPVDLALLNTADLAEDELRGVIEARLQAWTSQLATMKQLRESAELHLSELERMTFEHTLARLRTEVTWHEGLLERFPKLIEDTEGET